MAFVAARRRRSELSIVPVHRHSGTVRSPTFPPHESSRFFHSGPFPIRAGDREGNRRSGFRNTRKRLIGWAAPFDGTARPDCHNALSNHTNNAYHRFALTLRIGQLPESSRGGSSSQTSAGRFVLCPTYPRNAKTLKSPPIATFPNSRGAPENDPDADERARLEAVVEKVIGAAYEVSNVLGSGFLEKVYERALIEELSLRGIRLRAQLSSRLPTKASPSERIRQIWLWMTACWWKSNVSSNSPTSTWHNASIT